MDSVERRNRARYGFGERGEKLYRRNPEDDHKKDKAKAAQIRADNKEINEYDPSDKGRREKDPDEVNDQQSEKEKRKENENKKAD